MDGYFTQLAEAFVRGRLRNPLASLTDGAQAGLRLHKFKQDTQLPRVQRILGVLQGLQPRRLLDVGSGRGTFLWPLLHAFPDVQVTSIELSEQRLLDLESVRRGGITRLTVSKMSAEKMAFGPKSFDVVTMLEVLEHMPNPQAALTCAVAAAQRFVLLSVPSVPDDNPEHLHLFSPEQLVHMAHTAGAARTTIEHVLNHRIVILRVNS